MSGTISANKLSCRSVWKLYGEGAGSFLGARATPPSPEEIRSAGLIAAVANVSIDVRAGEIFVIMGLSGSGKSTLVRCLSRLVEPTAGEILFDGRDLLAVPEKELIELRRHRMGMVFQHFALMPHLSVLDNVAFPLAIQGVERAKREARAREMIEGLDKPTGDGPPPVPEGDAHAAFVDLVQALATAIVAGDGSKVASLVAAARGSKQLAPTGSWHVAHRA